MWAVYLKEMNISETQCAQLYVYTALLEYELT